MVQLGVELEGIKTLRTLKDGLRECFAFLASAEASGTSEQAKRGSDNSALSLLQPRRLQSRSQDRRDSRSARRRV
jgi:hypothetical protein